MKIIIHIITITLISILWPSSASGVHPPAAAEERLYVSFKQGDMSEWPRVISDLQREYNRTNNFNTLYNLTHTQYGYIGYLIGAGDNSEAKKYIRIAEANVERLLNLNPKCSNALALRASLTAYKIALSPFRAPFLGPQSLSTIEQALAINSSSIQALIEKGNAKHYAPSLFGGSPKEATDYYSKAINLIVKENSGAEPQTWQYLNILTQLALAYEKADMPNSADRTYKHILSIAPDYKWVAEELYPR